MSTVKHWRAVLLAMGIGATVMGGEAIAFPEPSFPPLGVAAFGAAACGAVVGFIFILFASENRP